MTGPFTWSRRAPRSLGALAICCIAGLVAAGCGASAGAPVTSSQATRPTSTTLPVPVEIIGSNTPSTAVGPIFRVPAVPVPDGAIFPPPLPSGVVNLPGTVKIGFRQLGSGPDLLLIMGQHGTMTWWDPTLLAQLASRFRVTLFDLPGVGYSQPSAANSIDAYADITAGLVGALGLTQPVVMGWGLGGQVAIALAERHRGLASRLVLVDTGAGGSTAAQALPAVRTLFSSPFATAAELAATMFPPAAEVAMTGWLTRIATIPPDDIVASGVQVQAGVEAALAHTNTLRVNLHRINVPTLVVSGSLDQVFPATNAAVLAAEIPHAHQVVYANGGYGAMFQHLQDFVSALETFASP